MRGHRGLPMTMGWAKRGLRAYTRPCVVDDGGGFVPTVYVYDRKGTRAKSVRAAHHPGNL